MIEVIEILKIIAGVYIGMSLHSFYRPDRGRVKDRLIKVKRTFKRWIQRRWKRLQERFKR